jgi:hypothetical protein
MPSTTEWMAGDHTFGVETMISERYSQGQPAGRLGRMTKSWFRSSSSTAKQALWRGNLLYSGRPVLAFVHHAQERATPGCV